ncbi:hypothetical protein P389DRAFT_72859 [Cystobasidium minutum MCA 4210]|uniref:uncharacterized protein n=1 Tax=Cystobasidium minutum MCA 4210 TaxID=1397322 RepID=UPI0034CFD993|eukprot:jgi/Rhomi1/72859/CE72858_172
MCCSPKRRVNNANYGACGFASGWWARRAARLAAKALESDRNIPTTQHKVEPSRAFGFSQTNEAESNSLVKPSRTSKPTKRNPATKAVTLSEATPEQLSRRLAQLTTPSREQAPPPYHEATRGQ